MPALDQLQAELGDDGFEVVAVSLDRGGPEKPKKFLDEIGVEIEHPFPLLPMYHLSSAIQNNVANQFLSMAMGPPQP